MDQVGLFATNGGFEYEQMLWEGDLMLLPGDSVRGPVRLPIPGNTPLGIYSLTVWVAYDGFPNGQYTVDVEVLP